MARGKSASKSEAKVEKWFEASENKVEMSGVVKRILFEGEKVLKFTLETVKKTPKGNWAHSFITIVSFDPELEVEEGEEIGISGYITTDCYEDKKHNKTYSTFVVAEEVSQD